MAAWKNGDALLWGKMEMGKNGDALLKSFIGITLRRGKNGGGKMETL
jgi:hypothetical protein